jgi:hypothetical protein
MPNWQSRLSIALTSWQNTITFNSVVLMSKRLKIVAWQSDTSVMLKIAYCLFNGLVFISIAISMTNGSV